MANFKMAFLILAAVIMVMPLLNYSKKTTPEEKKTEKEETEYKRQYSDYQLVIWQLKNFEGFSSQAYWDVDHWSIGYGTPSSEGETITKLEASEKMVEFYEKTLHSIQKKYPCLTEWQQRIVALFDYNIGSIGPNLDAALKEGDIERASQLMLLYNNPASSKGMSASKIKRIKKSLKKRRKEEIRLFHMSAQDKDLLARRLKQKL